MSQRLPSSAFLPGIREVIEQFTKLMEYVVSGRENQTQWQPEPPWFLNSPEGIISDLKDQSRIGQSELAAGLQFVLEQGLVEKRRIVCLLRTQHPLSFVFRLYCQRHGSLLKNESGVACSMGCLCLYCQRHGALIENWLDGWVTERELSNMLTLLKEMQGAELRFIHDEFQCKWIQALEHLVAHGFSGLLWCDSKLTEAERLLFVQITRGNDIQIMETPSLGDLIS